MYDLIIIGAGPSGLASSIYGRRAGLNVLVIEGDNIGGQVSSAHIIENYPGMASVSGYDLVMSMYEHAESLGAEFAFERAIKVESFPDYKEVITEDNHYQALAVILATGVVPRTLNLENEQKFIGKGISYCAICDGAFYKDKEVAIIGGGNSAVMEACYLAEIAKKVYVIQDLPYLTSDAASKKMLEAKDNIEVHCSSKLIKLVGEEALEGIIVNEDDEEKKIDVNGIFISIGKIPRNQLFENVCKLDDSGYFNVDESLNSQVPGIFVAGDCRAKEIRQITTATSDGAVAAIKASNYIKKIKAK